MKRIVYITLFLLGFIITAIGQESKLANEYYHTGEYAKAASLYKKLYEKTSTNDYYFNRYIEKQYDKAIKKMSPNQNIIMSLGNSFIRLTKYDYALKTYQLGSALIEDGAKFSNQLADIYRRKGDDEQMLKHYLLSLKREPRSISNLKNQFSRFLVEEQYDILKEQLYEQLQENPENKEFPELLEWVFIQRKEYSKALRQAKSLDRRSEENGKRVFNIAVIAANDKDYDTALAAYEYIVAEKGATNSYYRDARQAILTTKKKQVLQNGEYTREQLLELKAAYNTYLNEVGRNQISVGIISELAILEAYYLHDIDAAIVSLKDIIAYPNVAKHKLADAKLKLGDFYLIKNEIWESTLLYSQVDKDYREAYFGELARFKNAKLSYYNGDFEWAQSQFDILKTSTSKLISNDAIDLSVFITDNMGLDTTEVPMQMYAQTELLTFQNKLLEAATMLEEIEKQFPDHTLLDDIYYAKAHIFYRRNQYDKAVDMYEKIIANHSEEIRCDNALIELARLNEYKLNDINKALELYEKLFIDFSNSTFAVEARKKFRELRGDEI